MKTNFAMAALLAMLTLSACQSGSSVSGTGGGGVLTYATAMQQVDAGQPAVLLWIQGISCPF